MNFRALCFICRLYAVYSELRYWNFVVLMLKVNLNYAIGITK